MAVIVLVIEAQLYAVASSTCWWVSLRASPNKRVCAGSEPRTSENPPPTTPCCFSTESNCGRNSSREERDVDDWAWPAAANRRQAITAAHRGTEGWIGMGQS